MPTTINCLHVRKVSALQRWHGTQYYELLQLLAQGTREILKYCFMPLRHVVLTMLHSMLKSKLLDSMLLLLLLLGSSNPDASAS
jgi:hypothetical protein